MTDEGNITDAVDTLIAWLRKRGEPDSGINYVGRSHPFEARPQPASATLYGFDADFIAKHFHGQGARDLADALASRVRPAGEPFVFVPINRIGSEAATEIESLRARVAVLEGPQTPDPNVTADALLRIRNSCEGQDGHVTIWATMLQKIVDSVREARRALTPVAETPNQEPAS